MHDYGCSSLLPLDDPRLEEYARQRAERGFDDTETWCLSTAMARFLVPRLKRFKEVNNGYPATLTAEKWDEILQQIIDGMEHWLDRENLELNHQFDEAKVREAVRLLSEWYFDLWW